MIIQHQTVYTELHNLGTIGHLIRPDDDKTYPGLVMIQEWWGIEPHVLDIAERAAREGFVVMVPDLYHGKVANEPDDAMKLVMAMRQNLDVAIGEVVTACTYLYNNIGVQPKKLGVMGFCMGGMLTYKVAERYPNLGAISPWYGGGYDPSAEDVAKVSASVLAIYGALDGGIPEAQVKKIESLYKNAGKDAEFKIYEGAGHAFLNPSHGALHQPSATDAWARAMAFFKAKLV